ncbi:spore germination protein [Paenibacillus guangzhouensis]|uniref:spore germination protein n=1 Tax=Paenibacillus guangzhouensis TaxID=1473112 RepID=UPI0012670F54|nr:spore germination protein [Paenibacillus guangzhouensis]
MSSQEEQQLQEAKQLPTISSNLADNLMQITSLFEGFPDLVIREFTIQSTRKAAALVYLGGLTDKNSVNNNVLEPLLFQLNINPTVSISHFISENTWDALTAAILGGNSVLFVNGHTEASILDTQGWPQRSIEDPQIEASLKGAHQGFVETGSQNIALIRRYIPTVDLKIKEITVGARGNTTVSLMYLGDIAQPKILEELEKRIRKIDVDAIINAGELGEFIEDNPFSPFPQFISTERPDSAASQLLQGRFVMIVDGSPNVLIGPTTFVSFFQSIDDYSTRWLIASFIRVTRYFAFFIALFLPAIYIALISYNYVVIPIKLIISIGESRERVPFPPFAEAILMEITLEMLREAGIRLPAPIGQTVGIVGGIVIGQAAVQAGIVSNIMVIVVASTAIASFILPNYDMGAAVRFLRFPMMIIASIFGIVGIAVGLMTLIIHLITLKSLDTPYGSPLAPVRFVDWKDTFIRAPLWIMKKRPVSSVPVQLQRQGPTQPEENT